MERAPFFATSEARNNASVVDEWSPVHFGTGLLAGMFGFNAWAFVGLSSLYEVAESWHETPNGSSLFGSKGPEWDVNMVADIALSCAGYAIGAWLAGRKMPEPARA